MEETQFSLVEFTHSKSFEVQVKTKVVSNNTQIVWNIEGDISQIQLPLISTAQGELKKSQDLWKETCFECFFFEKNSPQYTELNLTLDGRYDFLFFSSYRCSKTSNNLWKISDFKTEKSPHNLKLHVVIRINEDISFDDLLIQNSIIIKLKSGKSLYYAKSHPKNQPDFHVRL